MRRALQHAAAAARARAAAPQRAAGAARSFADEAAGGAAGGAGEPEPTATPARVGRSSKKPTRKQRGSYAQTLPAEIESWPYEQLDGPLYNVRELVQPPGSDTGRGPLWGLLAQQQQLLDAAGPAAPLPADAEPQEGAPVPAQLAPPYAGASRLLRWSTQIVLSAGYDQRHPLSNKVEVELRLRDLAAEVGLSPAGVAWIAALCGPRYKPHTDTLRLVSQRYFTREDNRRDCLRIINDLIDEGAREGGGLDPAAPGAAAVLARQMAAGGAAAAHA